MEKFRCFYLDPSIEEPFSLENSFYNKTLNPLDWFNHLFEEEVTITKVNDGDVVIKVGWRNYLQYRYLRNSQSRTKKKMLAGGLEKFFLVTS